MKLDYRNIKPPLFIKKKKKRLLIRKSLMKKKHNKLTILTRSAFFHLISYRTDQINYKLNKSPETESLKNLLDRSKNCNQKFLMKNLISLLAMKEKQNNMGTEEKLCFEARYYLVFCSCDRFDKLHYLQLTTSNQNFLRSSNRTCVFLFLLYTNG